MANGGHPGDVRQLFLANPPWINEVTSPGFGFRPRAHQPRLAAVKQRGAELVNAAVKCFEIHRWEILSLPERHSDTKNKSRSLLMPKMQLPSRGCTGAGFKPTPKCQLGRAALGEVDEQPAVGPHRARSCCGPSGAWLAACRGSCRLQSQPCHGADVPGRTLGARAKGPASRAQRRPPRGSLTLLPLLPCPLLQRPVTHFYHGDILWLPPGGKIKSCSFSQL